MLAEYVVRHLGSSMDGSDWRFVIREKWIDLDVAIAMFPDRQAALERVAEATNSKYPYLPDDVSITDPASGLISNQTLTPYSAG
jgi:hypothetical protein